jgi:hypothetical protein
MTFEYDDLADVMHVSFAHPTSKCTYMDGSSGAILRIEESSGRIVGARILGFQRALQKGPIEIPELNDPHFVHNWLADHRA